MNTINLSLYLYKDILFLSGSGYQKSCSLEIIIKWYKEGCLKLEGKLDHQMGMGVACNAGRCLRGVCFMYSCVAKFT